MLFVSNTAVNVRVCVCVCVCICVCVCVCVMLLNIWSVFKKTGHFYHKMVINN